MHIQDNPSATCAMKIRPLCRGNVIVCMPSSDCTVKVSSKVLKICSFVPGFIDIVTEKREKKVTLYLGYSLCWSPFVIFMLVDIFFLLLLSNVWDSIISFKGLTLFIGESLSVLHRDQQLQPSALQVGSRCQRKCWAQGTMNTA